jgi:UTP-glucose-1-phosphate uridylyltransferase
MKKEIEDYFDRIAKELIEKLNNKKERKKSK